MCWFEEKENPGSLHSSWIYTEMISRCSVVFGQNDTENTWKIKETDKKSLLNLH